MKGGFKWIDCQQEEKCIYVFERKSKKQRIIALFNFSDKKHTYEMTVADIEQLHMILASNEKRFGGNTTYKTREYAVFLKMLILIVACYILHTFFDFSPIYNYVIAFIFEIAITFAAYEIVKRIPIVRYFVLGIVRKSCKCFKRWRYSI